MDLVVVGVFLSHYYSLAGLLHPLKYIPVLLSCHRCSIILLLLPSPLSYPPPLSWSFYFYDLHMHIHTCTLMHEHLDIDLNLVSVYERKCHLSLSLAYFI